MNIDLRTDSKVINDYLTQRVRNYPVYVNNGPGEDDGPISQITLGYQISQAGWVALIFDTRPCSSPDGEWQSYIEENWLEFPHWLEAVDSLYESGESIEVTLPSGKKRKLGEEDDISELFGKMLKGILVNARKNKLFNDLPLASKCSMGIEDHDGAYGWPNYDSRDKDGRVV